jgi:hypothetical protein
LKYTREFATVGTRPTVIFSEHEYKSNAVVEVAHLLVSIDHLRVGVAWGATSNAKSTGLNAV